MFAILCNMGFTAECSGKEVLDILTLSAFIKKFNVSEIYTSRFLIAQNPLFIVSANSYKHLYDEYNISQTLPVERK